jgi:glycosyltransferase involved in cell wall biosynthesis
MRGIKLDDFAKFLKESYVSVWVDLESGFGTYPLESMACGTPVIGKVPSLKPEWMDENNGVWTYEFNEIIDIIANFTQNWLEDNISESLYNNMKTTAEIYSTNSNYEKEVIETFEDYIEKRKSSFEEQLVQIKETTQN